MVKDTSNNSFTRNINYYDLNFVLQILDQAFASAFLPTLMSQLQTVWNLDFYLGLL